MTAVLADVDLAEMPVEQKRELLEQRLRGYRVTLASSLLDRAAIINLSGSEEQVQGSDNAIAGLRAAIALHTAELDALPNE